jgi:hypothetical protein
MRDRRHIIRLVGETAREVGILVCVFVPLDAAFSGVETDVLAISLFLIAGLVFIGCGILLETS